MYLIGRSVRIRTREEGGRTKQKIYPNTAYKNRVRTTRVCVSNAIEEHAYTHGLSTIQRYVEHRIFARSGSLRARAVRALFTRTHTLAQFGPVIRVRNSSPLVTAKVIGTRRAPVALRPFKDALAVCETSGIPQRARQLRLSGRGGGDSCTVQSCSDAGRESCEADSWSVCRALRALHSGQTICRAYVHGPKGGTRGTRTGIHRRA